MRRLTPLQAIIWAIFFRSIGYFLLIGLWAIMFLEPPFSFAPEQIALLLGLYAFADRGMALFWASWVPKFGFKRSLTLGYGLAIVSLLAVLLHQSFVYCFVFFLMLGAGLSLSNLSARLWLATIDDEKERLMQLGRFYRAVNLGAGLAPVIGFSLPYQRHPLLIVFSVALCYVGAFLCIHRFFVTEVEPQRSELPLTKLIVAMYHQIGKRLGVFSIYATFGLGVYALSHAHVLAFYYKTYFAIPAMMGWILASNPIFIVVSQKWMSRLFMALHERSSQSGFLFGLAMMALGFVAMAVSGTSAGAWGFMFFTTIGELMIYPHTDFVLSQKVPRHLMPYLMAMMGVTMAVGQSLSDSSSITALSLFSGWGFPPQTWWTVNAFIFIGIVCFGFALRSRRQVPLSYPPQTSTLSEKF